MHSNEATRRWIQRSVGVILGVSFADNTKARFLQSDGTYLRAHPGPSETPHRSQFEFVTRAAAGIAGTGKTARGTTKYPRVKLAPSPFSALKR